MLYESLDPGLADGIEAVCQNDWTSARSLLTQRLDETRHLGCRRATLFLLAFVARESGHGEVAKHLLEESRRTPADLAEPRILSEQNLSLQNEWLTFNHWSVKEPDPFISIEPPSEIDWAALLDATLEGRSAEFERRWSGNLVGNSPDRHVLWNLLALAYLENGDLRTYDEMYAQRQAAPPDYQPAVELQALLKQASLDKVVDELKAGRWLTSSVFVAGQTPEPALSTNGESLEWREAMESAFSLLSVGRAVEAARQFGLLISQSLLGPNHRTYTLNALALALFQSGEYADAEEALRDFRTSEQTFDPAAEPNLQEAFAIWLHSAGVSPEANSPFHNPFGKAPQADQLSVLMREPSSQEFYEGIDSVLGYLKTHDLPSAMRILRVLFSNNDSNSVTERFVVALFFAGTALLDGDHLIAQEGIEDASGILEGGVLDTEALGQVKELLSSSGASHLAEKFELSQLHTLDPWRDFPLDFPQGSESHTSTAQIWS